MRILQFLVIAITLWTCFGVQKDEPYVVAEETRNNIVKKYSTRNVEKVSTEKMSVEKNAISSNPDLRERSKRTYEQVIPCLHSAWLMDGKTPADTATWKLPIDAELHFEQLKNATAKFRQAPVHEYSNYKGPWIENIFIEKFLNKPLSYFNGFIPLFIQWIDIQILRGRHFDNIHNELNNLLRPGVIYLAISQGDVGLGKIGTAHPNIMVLSAGGYGHVPLPLVKSEIPYSPPPRDSEYTADITFFGNMNQASRPAMLDQIKKKTAADTTANASAVSCQFSMHAPDWQKLMLTSRFNLAPRGYGRSSFRFAEIIQMGRVPVFLWDDVPWIPYQGTAASVEHFGFQRGLHKQIEQVLPVGAAENYHNHVHQKVKVIEKEISLETLVDECKAAKASTEVYAKLLDAVRDVRFHYTYAGVVHAIEEFIADPFDARGKGSKTGQAGNYLRCTKHPRTERCCDQVSSHTYADSIHPYSDAIHT
jgi:hypothetical protein